MRKMLFLVFSFLLTTACHESVAFTILPTCSTPQGTAIRHIFSLSASSSSSSSSSNDRLETQNDVVVTTTTPPLSQADMDQRLIKLQEALETFQSSAAKDLLTEISGMRELDPTVREAFLDRLLSQGPDQSLPVWTRWRATARFSKRARLASLKRTLDWSTPPPSSEDGDKDDDNETNQQRRRRRAFLSILRALSSSDETTTNQGGLPAIVELELRAKREQQSSRTLSEDMIRRRPADLETPNYSVVAQRSVFEIRHYEPYSLCSVSMSRPRPVDAYTTDAAVADPQQSGARAFGALAGYLFGKNEQQSAMKMTTPVLTREQEGGDKVMFFVLPSEFWNNLTQAPSPLSGSGVNLEEMKGEDRAVLMFGGYASKDRVDKRKEQLIAALANDKDWEAVSGEPVFLAQYNDPFTPPWKRLNEVSVLVKPRSN